MGIDRNGLIFLLSARVAGVSFERTATLGRQSMHVDGAILTELLSAFGYPTLEGAELERICPPAGGYCEPLLELMGAGEVCSIDASAFEDAGYVHDLNRPIPKELKQSFTAVIDAGTLEHVFNFPQSISNAMEMVALGGHLLAMTPANNDMGHGFYQFSPELYFRVLSPENGFRVQRLYLAETPGVRDWWEVRDPALIRSRVTLVNSRTTYILVQAIRNEVVPLFRTVPQQSDYAAAWKAGERPDRPDVRRLLHRTGLSGRVARYLPEQAKDVLRSIRRALTPAMDATHARRVSLREIVARKPDSG